MKSNIHPKTNEVEVVCSCGNKFITISTKSQTIRADVCYKCHPFYTGEHRFVDSKGRVDVFMRKQKAAENLQTQRLSKKKKNQEKSEYQPKSLRELLAEN